MKLPSLLLILLYGGFTETLTSKSVNVTLETVLEFDNKHNSGDVHFIDNVQTFLDKVKTFISKPANGRRIYNVEEDETFTGFLQRAADILTNYDDDDLEDLVSILDYELRKYNYKGCEFNELIENSDVIRSIARTLRKNRNVPSKDIKVKLLALKRNLQRDIVDDDVRELLGYVNSLYKDNDRKKFRSILSGLENYRSKSKRANLDLIEIIRNGVRSVLFDRYTDLNVYARQELKFMIEKFWKQLAPDKQESRYVVYSSSQSDQPDTSIKPTDKNINEHITVDEIKDALKLYETSKPVKKVHRKRTTRYKVKTKDDATTESVIKSKKVYHHKFISLYPEEISTDRAQKKRLIDEVVTTVKYQMQRLWSKKIDKKRLNKSKKKSFKSVYTIVTDNGIGINVVHTNKPKETHSNSHAKKKKKIRHRNHHARRNSSVRHYKQPKEKLNHEDEAVTKYRKHFKPLPLSTEEGLAIESFEDTAIMEFALRKSNTNDTFDHPNNPIVDHNVLKRIDNLENELKDVKTKIQSHDVFKTTINNKDSFETLDFWEGTPKFTKSTNNKTVNVTIFTSTIKTTEQTKMSGLHFDKSTTTEMTTAPVTKNTISYKTTHGNKLQNITQGVNLTMSDERKNKNKTMRAQFSNTAVKQDDNVSNKMNDTIPVHLMKSEVLTTVDLSKNGKDVIKKETSKTTQTAISTRNFHGTETKVNVNENIRKDLDILLGNIDVKTVKDNLNTVVSGKPPAYDYDKSVDSLQAIEDAMGLI